MADDDLIRATIDAYRAEGQAMRAEIAAYRAEVVAWRERLELRFDHLDAEVTAIAQRLFREDDEGE